MHQVHSDRMTDEDFSTVSLLKRGLDAIQCGRESEGVVFLSLARKRLSSDQRQLTIVLDSFLEGFTEYLLVQQVLHEASVRFAEACSQLQASSTALMAVLPTLIQEADVAPPSILSANGESGQLSQTSSALVSNSQMGESLALCETQPQMPYSTALPLLSIICLGRFEVRRLDSCVTLCSNRNGQAILRYLIAQPSRDATAERLLAVFWPDDEPEVAQHKLHIAISALRRSLNEGQTTQPDTSYILYKNRTYYLNPSVEICTDVDKFLHYYQTGRQNDEIRIASYEQACSLYIGPFLPEDRYSDWSFLRRERLSQIYLTMCRELADYYLNSARYEEALSWTTILLKENRCDEGAHRTLIQIYTAQGQRSEALQQYQRCKSILHEELHVQPLAETTCLYQTLLSQEPHDG